MYNLEEKCKEICSHCQENKPVYRGNSWWWRHDETQTIICDASSLRSQNESSERT